MGRAVKRTQTNDELSVGRAVQRTKTKDELSVERAVQRTKANQGRVVLALPITK